MQILAIDVIVSECRMSDILIQNEVIIDVLFLTKHLRGSYINS